MKALELVQNGSFTALTNELFEIMNVLPSSIDELRKIIICPVKSANEGPLRCKVFHNRNEEVEHFISDFIMFEGVRTRIIDYNGCGYRHSIDLIDMVKFEDICNSDLYYYVYLHELGHATGHKARLHRNTLVQFGKTDAVYAQEELIAELYACFMLESFGMFTDELKLNCAIYLKAFFIQLDKRDKEEYDRLADEAKNAVCFSCGAIAKKKSMNEETQRMFEDIKRIQFKSWTSPHQAI